MDKAADPEIILRLVKYLQNVKQASKTAKLKKPFENGNHTRQRTVLKGSGANHLTPIYLQF